MVRTKTTENRGRAFLWHEGVNIDLGTLYGFSVGGAVNDGGQVAGTSAAALNNHGAVIGTVQMFDFAERAFVWRHHEASDRFRGP